MSITFKQTIIHNLDLNMGQPLLSKECVTLSDEAESFITRKLYKVIENQGTCEAKFKQQMSLYEEDQPYSIILEWKDNKFKRLAEILAKRFYSYMNEYGNIANGDLVVTNYLMDSKEYIAAMKINFNADDYTHYYNQDEEAMRLIANKNIYGDKMNEAVVFGINDNSIKVLDGTRIKYLQLLFDLETKLSSKEKLNAMDKVAAKVIDEHYDNPVKAIAELKNNISESIARTQTIPIQEIMEKTFGDDEEVLESCKQHLEEFGLSEEHPIEVRSSKVANKYATQKLKTDTGIEIKMSTHLFKDPDFVEIINEPNGTQTLLIKNISQLVNK